MSDTPHLNDLSSLAEQVGVYTISEGRELRAKARALGFSQTQLDAIIEHELKTYGSPSGLAFMMTITGVMTIAVPSTIAILYTLTYGTPWMRALWIVLATATLGALVVWGGKKEERERAVAAAVLRHKARTMSTQDILLLKDQRSFRLCSDSRNLLNAIKKTSQTSLTSDIDLSLLVENELFQDPPLEARQTPHTENTSHATHTSTPTSSR